VIPPVRLFERRALRRALRELADVPAGARSCPVLLVAGVHAPLFLPGEKRQGATVPARVLVGAVWLRERLRAECEAVTAAHGPV